MASGLLAAAAVACACAGLAVANGRPHRLPPTALRGNEHALAQYPAVRFATREERRAARRLLARIRAATLRWPTPRAAARAGFGTTPSRRRSAGMRVGYLHAEHRRHSADRRYLDPLRPEALIYANVRSRPLALVGLMFSMPRGRHGATPGGPITRWHTHTVCMRGQRRGLTPGPGGRCPAGTRKREGSEMLHVWLTHDVRSAFAIHGPLPELCRDGLLGGAVCAGHPPRHRHVPPAGAPMPARPPDLHVRQPPPPDHVRP